MLFRSKIYTTSFIGPPTAEYQTMFELAADGYRQIVAALKPGVCGRDLASVLAGGGVKGGYKLMSFITGWSTVNTRPVLFSQRIEKADYEFPLQPGYCLNVGGWVTSEDQMRGVWVGDTVAITDSGVRRFHTSTVDNLDANILG